jgi:hypothetical protein
MGCREHIYKSWWPSPPKENKKQGMSPYIFIDQIGVSLKSSRAYIGELITSDSLV